MGSQSGARRTHHLIVATAAIVVLAACGGSATDPTPTPTVPATVVVGLRAPVASNQTLTVYNGYDNPLVPSPCPKPGTAPHDHCGNQEYGLDFIPSDLADPRILAPISGKIGWPPGTGPLACLGITPTGTSTLNLTVCHFAADAIFVEQDDVVVQGQVLGLRDPRAWWIHLSLDDRAISPFQPVPFYDAYWIEGVAFVPRNPPVFDLYCGVTIKSTNGVAEDDPHADEAPYTTYAAAPALSCPPETPARTATPTATLAPTATSTLAPTPTPKPTLVPTPKPTPRPTATPKPTAVRTPVPTPVPVANVILGISGEDVSASRTSFTVRYTYAGSPHAGLRMRLFTADGTHVTTNGWDAYGVAGPPGSFTVTLHVDDYLLSGPVGSTVVTETAEACMYEDPSFVEFACLRVPYHRVWVVP